MTLRKKEKQGLGDFFISRRRTKRSFLDDVNEIIDWRPIARFLKLKIKRKANVVGSPAYPEMFMFKILLLQKWYNLSDEAVEFAICDRLSFVRFLDMSIEDEIPDSTTICRFRNGLIILNIYEKLLFLLNEQLEEKQLLVRNGSIVDASVIGSSRRPRKTIDTEIVSEDRNEDVPKYEVSYSDDTGAAWLKKAGKFHYGFKVHMGTDAECGFILGGIMTPANYSDTGQFTDLVNKLNLPDNAPVFADKGYTSQKNRTHLIDNNLQDGIMFRNQKNRKLSELEKMINRGISSVRYIVERSFGTLKQHFRFDRSRYVGIEKVEAEFNLVAMAFNIKKAVRMVC
ncbi:IS5 family transposase [Maridesulfovibrio ferrireducens]|uniref:IS5 family transposase n=1 Tax=Maridesulfovibrio ferrireducens TaxID=246191 RepID=UPI001A268708|nr:IS5 family transposase [Maridesulfovibrio ferrireducens]MBI9113338.1 IS5 family transposase [Maridesulfovibrio ferrireducens]